MRDLSPFVLVWSMSFALPVLAQSPVSKKKESESAAASTTSGPPTNTCGCYEDSAGMCRCVKKNRCGCPGECEPSGCEEKRSKELDKQTQQELKRQQEEDKKRNAELEKKRDELDRKDAEKRERGLRGLRLIEQDK